jgi:hypothetical protein
MMRSTYLCVAVLAAITLMAAGSDSALAIGRDRDGKDFESQARAILAAYAASSSATTAAAAGEIAPCCYQPCITYHYLGCKKRCCGCEPPVPVVLTVVDPCCCCAIEVPVCLPARCVGCEPCVTSRCGVLGRGIVEYKWDCGFRVRIVINKGGDVRVTYIGA